MAYIAKTDKLRIPIFALPGKIDTNKTTLLILGFGAWQLYITFLSITTFCCYRNAVDS